MSIKSRAILDWTDKGRVDSELLWAEASAETKWSKVKTLGRSYKEEGKMKLQEMIQEIEKESSSKLKNNSLIINYFKGVIKSLEDQMHKLGQENKALQESCKGLERSEATIKQMIERMNQLEKENSEKEKAIERFKQFGEERKQLREGEGYSWDCILMIK